MTSPAHFVSRRGFTYLRRCIHHTVHSIRLGSSPLVPVGTSISPENVKRYKSWLCEPITETGEQRDLEIDMYDGNSFNDGVPWRELAEELALTLKGFTGRRSVHAPTMSLMFPMYDALAFAAMTARMTHCIEFAEIVGATMIVLHSPFLFFGQPSIVHSPADDLPDVLTNIHDFLNPWIPRLRAMGAKVVFETCYDRSSEPLIALVQSLPRDVAAISIDVGHLQVMHEQTKYAPAPHDFLRECLPLVEHLHLHDNDGKLDRHWSPGQCNNEGIVNWDLFLKELAVCWAEIQRGERTVPPRLIVEGDSDNMEETKAGIEFIVDGLTRAIAADDGGSTAL